jgi:hypothetical protein
VVCFEKYFPPSADNTLNQQGCGNRFTVDAPCHQSRFLSKICYRIEIDIDMTVLAQQTGLGPDVPQPFFYASVGGANGIAAALAA